METGAVHRRETRAAHATSAHATTAHGETSAMKTSSTTVESAAAESAARGCIRRGGETKRCNRRETDYEFVEHGFTPDPSAAPRVKTPAGPIHSRRTRPPRIFHSRFC
jgi:hypothetical protein